MLNANCSFEYSFLNLTSLETIRFSYPFLFYLELEYLLRTIETEKFKALIEYDPAYAVMLDEDHESLLHYAAEYNRLSVVELLLVHGCTVDMKTKWNSIPLHHAAWKNSIDVARLLLSYDVNSINAKTVSGQTPLHWAAHYNHEQMVGYLLRQPSIDVNIRSEYGKMADDMTDEDNIKSMIRDHRKRTK